MWDKRLSRYSLKAHYLQIELFLIVIVECFLNLIIRKTCATKYQENIKLLAETMEF